MRRVIVFVAMAFFISIAWEVAGGTFLSPKANTAPENTKQLLVCTTLDSGWLSRLAAEYTKETGVIVTVRLQSEEELLQQVQQTPDKDAAVLVIAKAPQLERLRRLGYLRPYHSEETEKIPEFFCDVDGYWSGIWFDPIAFAVNRRYADANPSQLPYSWQTLVQEKEMRLVLPDFAVNEESAQLLCDMEETYGIEETLDYFRKVQPLVVKYTQHSLSAVRMVSLGEADVAVAPQSAILQYRQGGFPLLVKYPAEGSSYTLMGAGVVQENTAVTAGKFLDWLLSPTAEKFLEKQSFYFCSVNPEYKSYLGVDGKPLSLFGQHTFYTPAEKQKMLNEWVKKVRFGRDDKGGK